MLRLLLQKGQKLLVIDLTSLLLLLGHLGSNRSHRLLSLRDLRLLQLRNDLLLLRSLRSHRLRPLCKLLLLLLLNGLLLLPSLLLSGLKLLGLEFKDLLLDIGSLRFTSSS